MNIEKIEITKSHFIFKMADTDVGHYIQFKKGAISTKLQGYKVTGGALYSSPYFFITFLSSFRLSVERGA